ncbi:MAG: hypothetical protein MZV64_43760 [Ignavibacteriales bacterium]|nr:hypothetical protein [Ignavibacteriales bacterium]
MRKGFLKIFRRSRDSGSLRRASARSAPKSPLPVPRGPGSREDIPELKPERDFVDSPSVAGVA